MADITPLDSHTPVAPSARGPHAPLRLGLAGLGTVGLGVIRLITQNAELIARRAGRPVVITAVCARDRHKHRAVDLSHYGWEEDSAALAARADVDVVVELIGGADGPALALARAAIAGGKALVTANKAMIAHHGLELAGAAEARGVALRFEAAVAGGVPIIKALREGAAANRIARIYGILNGTCNFILSTMEDTGRGFVAVLGEAQACGYAEADPSFDINGIDTAHKLAILSAIAFGASIDFASVDTAGIASILAADIAEAKALGYVIRLIGMAECEEYGNAEGEGEGVEATPRLFQRVGPHLVPIDTLLAHVDGPTNAVVVEGNFSGRLLFQGTGAGDGPTASAVVADIIDIARGMDVGFEADRTFSVAVPELVAMPPAATGHRRGRAYIRFLVTDRPGVLAEITAAMRDAGVSIESLIQRGQPTPDGASVGDGASAGDGAVLVAMVTHDGPEAAVRAALTLLKDSPTLIAPPLVMPILEA